MTAQITKIIENGVATFADLATQTELIKVLPVKTGKAVLSMYKTMKVLIADDTIYVNSNDVDAITDSNWTQVKSGNQAVDTSQFATKDDIKDFVKTADLNVKLSRYLTTADFQTNLSAYYTKTEIDDKLNDYATNDSVDVKNAATLTSAKTYADSVGNKVKSDLIDGAPDTLNTLKEIVDAMQAGDASIETTLNNAISKKADKESVYSKSDADAKFESKEDANAAISNKADQWKFTSDITAIDGFSTVFSDTGLSGLVNSGIYQKVDYNGLIVYRFQPSDQHVIFEKLEVGQNSGTFTFDHVLNI